MKIIWLSEASKSLDAIYNFYLPKSKTAADKIIADIYHSILRLSKTPFIASPEPLLNEFPNTYRSLVIRRLFKVIYRVDEEKQAVIIVTIWDCRQDPELLKFSTFAP
ncbi:type II toxin-antitoxin system RelE/ParE family toxin [Sphingobacterium sp. SGG-5]|uniref:type II toxin-antitoxin system RelE/ParE family toxin n=1 Tax=Sphingobacterium sp. SGG-5 TaxID=2710881 RepID=UPI0013EA6D8F|nr:type II toxin-antitoxin system RelE/ParE family toxin [Sphingobacterium sp. SGG-5]NGM61478.1 type II toxin-antitoxin system RelE/ParE family toxin [Sphingobacterium sp. SGG-5]